MSRHVKLIAILAALASGLLFASRAQASLIVNGDFEAGNTGFDSGYVYFPVPTNVPPDQGEGQYSVWSNPSAVHEYWTYPVVDHTKGDGTGKMMIVNAATTSLVVWSETVALVPGTSYSFSAWATSVYPTAAADLTFKIGSLKLGSLDLSGSQVGAWQNFTATFVAGTSGPLAINDLVTEASGNDFALDDISLTAVPEPATLVIWSLLGAGSWLGMRVWRRRGPGLGDEMSGPAPMVRGPWSPEARQAIHQIIARGNCQRS
jgi:hypothetical protein